MCAVSAAPNKWLHHQYHKVPVTAIAFLTENIILAGEGPLLIAYEWKSRRRLWSCHVFKSQSIHGILVCHNTLIVWGGYLIRAIEVSTDKCGPSTCEFKDTIKTEDWILDAALLSDSSGVLLITAHNALLHCSWERLSSNEEPSKLEACQSLVAGSNCILYSAHVKQLSGSIYLIASGTAFGDIIFWSYNRETEVLKIHYTFSAHDGSIFDVRISDFVCLPDGGTAQGLLLASCSDDRTIKIWNVSDLNAESPSLTKMQQDTGFGEKSRESDFSPPCLGQAMAHLSRIWKVRFLEDTSLPQSPSNSQHKLDDVRNGLRLRSFGEDASTLEWMLSPGVNGSFMLHQVSASSPHNGKNIWSTALYRGLVATGAADGSIAIIPNSGHFHAGLESTSAGAVELSSTDIRSYVFIDHNLLVGCDNHGQIHEMSLSAIPPPARETPCSIEIVSQLRGYSTMASVPGVTFIGSSRGQIYAYSHLQKKAVKIAEEMRKVTGLFTSANDTASLLITTIGSDTVTLLQGGYEGSEEFKFASKVLLPIPAGRIVTSFVLVSLAYRNIAVVGTRDGSIVLFVVKANKNEGTPQTDMRYNEPLLFSNIHHGEAVTSLSYKLAKDNGGSKSVFLFSTGRDGTFAAHKLGPDGEDLTFETMHQLSTPIAANVEGHAVVDDDQVYIWGFKRDDFVSYNLTLQREIMTVKCGGAHRNWAFQFEKKGGTLVWTRASQMFQIRQRELQWQSINYGGHGREIKSVAVTSTIPQLIATGAEDTDIKLFTLVNGALSCLHTLRKHNTGIQDLKWSKSGLYLFSSGGFEEFYIWRVSHGIPGVGVGVLCESKHPRSGVSDLRIMGFELTQESSRPLEFIIDMCYSDSSLKRWSHQSGQLQLLGEGSYLTSCLTHALHVNGTLLTSASDGYLASWEIEATGDLQWTRRHCVHQNAILAAAQYAFHDGSSIVITGSDDNAIGLTMYHEGEKCTSNSILISRAHAAAVTAITTAGQLGENSLIFVSAGIDQKIKVWRVTRDTGHSGVDSLSIERVASTSTAVADVSSISMVKLDNGDHSFLICGVGMDVWHLDLH